MSEVSALHFDGKSSDGREVVVRTADGVDARGMVHVCGIGIDLCWPLDHVRTSDRIGSSRRPSLSSKALPKAA